MNKADVTMIRIKKTTLTKFRLIGSRDLNDDEALNLLIDEHNNSFKTISQTGVTLI